ncbi:outer membrane lipoprotein-sorting protein [Paenibacillus sp. J2TS4]|uniref:outer membrane lipoprotein-sorting protein n=1 Tax=Paenibacillus sp. J2TS4 TaxID=2807194 RepID=UPI001B083305|nr:outer membrane lipoprotein-sorting protein [Paenibacillus sp. J2TS4]GIP35082.1 sporulation protein YdcC [Paenibacillus sp. J2TS4]
MRRVTWMAAIVLGIAVILSGCGAKDAGTVVKELDEVIAKMESYQGVGRMTLHTGQEPQEYQVEVWFKKPHYYRIALTNDKKDITQIVLRNDEGVYVLTPHLNKSFRFQSNWPDNQGQVYLFQSIAESIQMDKERQLTTEDNAYVFDVSANYQNASLVRQKVWLDKKTLGPQNIEVSDASNNVMVSMEFTHFEFNKEFDKDSFDMQRNMTASLLPTTPTMLQGEGQQAAEDGQQARAEGEEASINTKQQTLVFIDPAYLPEGVTQSEVTEVKLGDGKGLLQRYTGTYNYTLLQSRPVDRAVSVLPTEIVDLGYTLAVLTGEDQKTLVWTYDGVEFRLSSGDLPVEEMAAIAQSVQGQSLK